MMMKMSNNKKSLVLNMKISHCNSDNLYNMSQKQMGNTHKFNNFYNTINTKFKNP